MDSKKTISKYKARSAHYFENALHFIEVGDTEKASEFLWGSMAQALKAVAAIKERQLRSHNAIRDYALELSKELKDDAIRHAFDKAQSLHSNFYESGLTMEDVAVGAEDVKSAVGKLLKLLPEETSS